MEWQGERYGHGILCVNRPSLCHHGKPNKKPALQNTNIPSLTQYPTFLYCYTFHIRILFNCTATAIILNANFTDVHEISLTNTKTLYIVEFAL